MLPHGDPERTVIIRAAETAACGGPLQCVASASAAPLRCKTKREDKAKTAPGGCKRLLQSIESWYYVRSWSRRVRCTLWHRDIRVGLMCLSACMRDSFA